MLRFWYKNKADLDYGPVTITVTDGVATDDGQDFVDFLRNRNNTSGWATTGSTDAANTTLIIDFVDSATISDVMLIKHNFKSYTVKYWTGLAYADFSTPIVETVNTKTSNYYSFNEVSTTKLQLIITGTQVPDSDKTLAQFIATLEIGRVLIQPQIATEFDKERKTTKFLSGKAFISRSVGSFACQLKMNNVVSDDDLTVVETLYDFYEGFLFSPSNGDETQYPMTRRGFRAEDIFFMNITNELKPQWEGGRYANGMPIILNLIEVN